MVQNKVKESTSTKIIGRTEPHQTCLHHTQTLVVMCQDLGCIVNMGKSELDPKHIFDFIASIETDQSATEAFFLGIFL